MSILKLQPNQPTPISLRTKVPRETEGQWGKQFVYSLNDGRILYLPPIAHAEIQSLNPGPGESFTILKSVHNGNAAIYSVERIIQPEPEKPAPKPMSAARAITPAATIPVPPSLTTRESIRIFNQLVATIQAVKAAEEFAKSIGYPVKFGPEDFRAMAISGFIEQSRRAA